MNLGLKEFQEPYKTRESQMNANPKEWTFAAKKMEDKTYVVFVPKDEKHMVDHCSDEERQMIADLTGDAGELIEMVFEVYDEDIVEKLLKAGMTEGQAAKDGLQWIEEEGYFENWDDLAEEDGEFEDDTDF